MKHLMIDCETLSLDNFPVIMSVAAVLFDPHGSLEVHEESAFYKLINISSYKTAGLRADLDTSTLRWWALEQDVKLFQETIGGAHPIQQVLMDLAHYIRIHMPSAVWSNDETADIVWLESHYKALGQDIPWGYRSHRCVRTIRDVAKHLGIEPDIGENPVKHDALQDAIHQAKYVCGVYEYLDLINTTAS